MRKAIVSSLHGGVTGSWLERKGVGKLMILAALYCLIMAAFLLPIAAQAVSSSAFSQSTTNSVTLTGEVSCGRCQNIQPPPKGYTRFSWALHSVSEGDDVVLLIAGKTYTLQGDRNQFLKYVGHKTTVNGRLDGTTVIVQMITPPGNTK